MLILIQSMIAIDYINNRIGIELNNKLKCWKKGLRSQEVDDARTQFSRVEDNSCSHQPRRDGEEQLFFILCSRK